MRHLKDYNKQPLISPHFSKFSILLQSDGSKTDQNMTLPCFKNCWYLCFLKNEDRTPQQGCNLIQNCLNSVVVLVMMWSQTYTLTHGKNHSSVLFLLWLPSPACFICLGKSHLSSTSSSVSLQLLSASHPLLPVFREESSHPVIVTCSSS